MTAKEKSQEHIHKLHEKHYAKRKAKMQQKAAAVEKKKADVAPQGKKTTGVGISSHPAAAEKGNGKVTRKDLMAQAQAKGIKYFRILHREELKEVLHLAQAVRAGITTAQHRTIAIQDEAKARWKAGWTAKKK